MNNLSAFLAKLEKLDSKQGKRNVKEKDIIMGECVLVGGAMYSMGIHYVIKYTVQYLVDCCVKGKETRK